MNFLILTLNSIDFHSFPPPPIYTLLQTPKFFFWIEQNECDCIAQVYFTSEYFYFCLDAVSKQYTHLNRKTSCCCCWCRRLHACLCHQCHLFCVHYFEINIHPIGENSHNYSYRLKLSIKYWWEWGKSRIMEKISSWVEDKHFFFK